MKNLGKLPVKNKLSIYYFLSLLIIIVIIILSIIGLSNIKNGIYGNDPNLISIFRGQDLIHLVLVIPIFIIILILTLRKSLIGLILWPGILFYIVYDYFYFIIGIPMSYLFILYLLVVILSIYTLISFLMNFDYQEIFYSLKKIPNKTIGIILISFSILTIVSILFSPGGLIPSLQAKTNINLQARLLWTLDPIFQVPTLLIVGILLLFQNKFGFAFCGGLLLQSCMFVNGKTIADIVNIVLNGNPTGGNNRVVTWIVLGFIGLILLVSFLIYIYGAKKSINE
jgi:hypothetical protein